MKAPEINFRLDEELHARLHLALNSPLEGRVPYGDMKKFFTARVIEWFEWSRLDLAPYGFPDGYFIKGPKEMLNAVRSSLESRRPE